MELFTWFPTTGGSRASWILRVSNATGWFPVASLAVWQVIVMVRLGEVAVAEGHATGDALEIGALNQQDFPRRLYGFSR